MTNEGGGELGSRISNRNEESTDESARQRNYEGDISDENSNTEEHSSYNLDNV